MSALALLLTVAAAGATTSTAPANPVEQLERFQQELFERVAPSVVLITQRDTVGTGFFVSGDGLVLTNAHVVRGMKTVDVVLHDGRRTVGTVVERAAGELDLALVKVPVANVPALTISGVDELRIGSWVASIGHGKGIVWTFTTGMVTNMFANGTDRPVFQTQIPLNPGTSGGPVVDRQGNVVGISTAGVQSANSINFCIRGDVAVRSLKQLGDIAAYLVIAAPQDAQVFVDGRMVGSGPRVAVQTRAGRHEIMVVTKGKMNKVQVAFPDQRSVDLTR